MPTKRFLIAPFKSGFQTNVRPFLIPDDATEEMINMYTFRSRWRKRFGSKYTFSSSSTGAAYDQYFSRMRIQVALLAAGAAAGTVSPNAEVAGTSDGAAGQLFTIGTNIFTVQTTGAPVAMLVNGTATTATFDTTNGAFSFTGVAAADGTPVYWYPAFPIMGISQFEQDTVNEEPTYVFDTRYVYTFASATGWTRDKNVLDEIPIWRGTNKDFFWTTSWHGATNNVNVFFVSNFNYGPGSTDTTTVDPLKYKGPAGWVNFSPRFNSTPDLIYTARLIAVFKDRLLLLNVLENPNGTTNLNHFGNRCRFSQNGDPTDAATSFLETQGRGGYIDAPTQEQIVSSEFLKDRLIVFFENSTWELVYTGNEILPFRWQKINTELGAESTFSIVPFDQMVLGIGNVGIHACNGASVQRIDDKIPDLVFDIRNEDGLKRVQGIRDYKVEQVYWTFPSSDSTTTYPQKVLVYDYVNNNWAINDDSITAFGYFQPNEALTWATWHTTWAESTWQWNSGINQTFYRETLGGNQEGFVFVVDPDEGRSAGVLQISNISGNVLTIVDNNLSQNDYIILEYLGGITISTGNTSIIAKVISISGNDVTIDLGSGNSFSGTYTGGGTAARNPKAYILTKQYNFMMPEGTNMTVNKIDVLVDRTVNGEFIIQSLPSFSDPSLPVETLELQTSPYDVNLYPLEQVQERFWHTIYPSINGEVCQFIITLSDDQMRDLNVARSDLVINAIMFHVGTTSSRFE